MSLPMPKAKAQGYALNVSPKKLIWEYRFQCQLREVAS
jgi:hypothetical protein